MKKIKFLAPAVAFTSLGGLVAPLATSCSCGHAATYKVSINKSDRFTYDTTKIGNDKAEAGKKFTIKITPKPDFTINLPDITVKINKKDFTDFTYENNTLTIPGVNVVGDIEINVDATYINIFKIDSTTHQLTGFKDDLTSEEIETICKGILTIPADVVSIAPYAFYDQTTKKSTIPSSIKRLVFAIDENGRNWLEGTTQTDSPSYARHGTAAIGEYSFAYAPIEFVDFPFDMVYDPTAAAGEKYDGHRYDIGVGAFFNSKIKVLKMPSPGYNLEDATLPDGRKVYKGNMKIFGDNKEFGKGTEIVWDDFKRAGFGHVEAYAFANCDNLTSVIWSLPQLAGGSIRFNAFGVIDETKPAGYANKPSNINYVDLSEVSITKVKYANDPTEQKRIYTGIYDAEKTIETSGQLKSQYGWEGDKLRFNYKINNNGLIKAPNFAIMCNLAGYPGETWQLLDKQLGNFTRNLYVGSSQCPEGWVEGNKIPYKEPQTCSAEYSNAGIRLDTVNAQQTYIADSTWYIGYDSCSIDTEFDVKVAQPVANNQNWIDNIYRFKNPTISVPISSFAQNKNNLNNTLIENGKIAYNLPSDMQFEIVSQEWTGGEANIALEQVPKEDVPESEQPTYKNNYYRVISKDGTLPTAGSKVVLSVKISSEMHNVNNIVESLTINFA